MTGDAEGVRTLLARYCRYLDDSRFDGWIRLFMPDGLWVLGEREYRGREAMHAYMRQLRQDRPAWRTRHQCSNLVIDLDGARGRVASDLALLAREGDAPWLVTSLGRYYDRIVLQPDSETWQFEERRLVVQ
jgi:3-phenylpropionate/cinnamic acid dioxygenase small subunit